MRWEQLTGSDSYCRLRVEADWVEVAADYEDVMKAYEHVRVPGFRAGKVPKNVIEQRFRKQLHDALSRRIGQRLVKAVLRESAMKPMGPVRLSDIEGGTEKIFRFTMNFLPMPEIELPDLGSMVVVSGEGDLRDRISRRLLDLVTFEVPDGLVAQELASGGDADTGYGSAQWQAARDRIRLMLILKRIAKQEGIEIDKSDVDRRIAEKAKEFGTSSAILRSELEEGDGISRLRDMLLAESTLDYLMERNCN